MQFEADTKAASRGSFLVAFDPRPEPKIEDHAHTEAQDFYDEAPEFMFDLPPGRLVRGGGTEAQSHSSFVRRTALLTDLTVRGSWDDLVPAGMKPLELWTTYR